MNLTLLESDILKKTKIYQENLFNTAKDGMVDKQT